MRIMTLLMSLLAVLMTPNALAKEYKIDSVSPEIWIYFGGVAEQPDTFDQHTLKSAGWKMVVNESEVEQHHESDAH